MEGALTSRKSFHRKNIIQTNAICHPHSVSLWRVRVLSLAVISVAADLDSMVLAVLGVRKCGEAYAEVLQAKVSWDETSMDER